MEEKKKIRVGFYDLTGCDGDLVTILNLDEKLFNILEYVEIVDFRLASSAKKPGPLDIAFVEGSVTTREDLEALKKIRENSKILVAIGTCAVWGGLQAANNRYSEKELYKTVYNTEENHYGFLGAHKPLSAYVKVDYELPGCPIEQEEFVNLFIDILNDNVPEKFEVPVCLECKLRGNPCILIEKNLPCLGPVTMGGCKARCPSLNTPCTGCRGPLVDEANVKGEYTLLLEKGVSKQDALNKLTLFMHEYKDVKKLLEEEKQ